VTAAAAPRLAGGFFASVVFHAGVIVALFVFAVPKKPAPGPPLYRVQLIAAPAGPRAAGVVEPAPAPPVKSTAPVPAPKTPPKIKPPTKTPAKPATAAKAATPVPTTKTAPPPKTDVPPPTAGGGVVGGKGTDVANVDTPGIDFPYPGYLQNIAREVIRQFVTPQTRPLVADVAFLLKRDGTVDPASIRLVTSSGNYSFDQRALGAVEAAANANRFGRLPDGFREDILPVTFRFTPSLR